MSTALPLVNDELRAMTKNALNLVLYHPVREKLLLRITAQILERQDRD